MFEGKKFELGDVVMTRGAVEAFERVEETPLSFLNRHAKGDWGDIPPSDKELNDQSIPVDEDGWGGRLHSSYKLSDGTVIWIITEADRSVTTFLLPSEY